MRSPDQRVRKASIHRIAEWFGKSNFAQSAIDLIKSTSDDTIKHSVGIMLIRCVMSNWINLDESVKSDIVQFFQSQVTNRNLSEDISYIFNRILALAAMYEFPENWNNFLIDLLFVPKDDENYVYYMKLLAQFVFEISRCNFLTSDRVIKLQELLLTFLDLFIPIIQNLIAVPQNVPYGLTILAGLLTWGNAPEILTPDFFPILLKTINTNNAGLIGTINCLSVAFFGRNDVIPMFSRMPLLLHQFANLQIQNPISLMFISKFMFKYLNQVEKLLDKTKNGNNPDNLPIKDDITKLFEITLDQIQCDDFWRLWRSILHRLSNPITQEPLLSFIQPIVPQICEKMAHKLLTTTEYGRIKNVDAQVFFELFVKRFHNEIIEFIKKSEPSPDVIYLTSLLNPSADSEFLNQYITMLLSEQRPETFSEPFLFLLSRSAEILNESHIDHFFKITNEFLGSSDNPLQISASRALLVAFDGAPKRFNAKKLIDNCKKHVVSICDTAVVLVFRLCATIIASLSPLPNSDKSDETKNVVFSEITNVALEMLKQRTAATLLGLRAMAFASGTRCYELFEPIWTPLLDLLENSKHEISSLVFDVIGGAFANCKLSDIQRPYHEITTMIFTRKNLSSLSFGFLALVRVEKPELDSLIPQIENLMRESKLSVSLFQMLTVFNPLSFDKNLILSLITQGIEFPVPEISIEAVNCAITLFYAISFGQEFQNENENLLFFQKPLINSIIKSLLDEKCQHGLDKKTEFLNEVFCCSKNSTNEFLEALKQYGVEPTDGFFEKFTEHLNTLKWSVFDFRVSLKDFILVIKKKAPFQMEMFIADDEGPSASKQ